MNTTTEYVSYDFKDLAVAFLSNDIYICQHYPYVNNGFVADEYNS